ncbi:MAG TPA: pyruvate, phosphate dikinase, partial [Phycisphaerae bacterium]|nr:pyruvate, phosphate dikinase [Phycisphaerae bacterium]
DIRLGVRVGYADINRTRMLVEVARDKSGYIPEVSFGTHFFQDLVESGIHYLPLYPDDPDNIFNDDFFLRARNVLPDLLPADAAMDRYLRVMHVPEYADGRLLHVAMDGETDRALAYLK